MVASAIGSCNQGILLFNGPKFGFAIAPIYLSVKVVFKCVDKWILLRARGLMFWEWGLPSARSRFMELLGPFIHWEKMYVTSKTFKWSEPMIKERKHSRSSILFRLVVVHIASYYPWSELLQFVEQCNQNGTEDSNSVTLYSTLHLFIRSVAQLAKVQSLWSEDHGFVCWHCVKFKDFIALGFGNPLEKRPSQRPLFTQQ